ncbi:tensin-4 isoform B [Alligator mississippiensis]|uniref:Tensin-4 isoform B n=1 Tax=Alligator mississippiensis TaxID=8496 RepID=A0A151PCA4_ALLMI|nr:tensin-4 isoform B [Alligator mississippiensis]
MVDLAMHGLQLYTEERLPLEAGIWPQGHCLPQPVPVDALAPPEGDAGQDIHHGADSDNITGLAGRLTGLDDTVQLWSPESHNVSSSTNSSGESLNKLILEIDPTFQPLAFQSVNGKKDAVKASALSNKSVTKQQESETLDIKYIEMTPTRAKCHESVQGSGSPSMTPLSRSPQGHCLLLQRTTQPNCSTNGSVVFSSFENLLKPLHAGRGQQRTSAVSQLSTSPGSDTSYMLGSSTPSLLNDDSETHFSTDSSWLTKGHHGSTKKAVPPNSSPTSGLSSLINTSSDSSLASTMDSFSKDGQPTMKFVMDTSKYWFKPSITREQAIELLKDKEPGTFIMRDSTSYRGSFGLAMKVLVSPSSSRTGDDNCDLVRHFLIESSAKGVHLKGASEEPYFGSLSAFVYQHAIMPLSLPSKLIIPSRDLADGDSSPDTTPESVLAALKKAAVCNVLYLNSVSMETLTGAPAIQKAITCTLELETPPMPTIVHFKATEQGITLTDVQRKVFFRRHYPLAIISFCSMDPDNRKWQKYCKSSRIFGFVAKSQTDSENVCHLFAEYDTVQPASLVIDFVSKLLPES